MEYRVRYSLQRCEKILECQNNANLKQQVHQIFFEALILKLMGWQKTKHTALPSVPFYKQAIFLSK